MQGDKYVIAQYYIDVIDIRRRDPELPLPAELMSERVQLQII